MKKEYTKPVITLVELVADETISLGCWNVAPSGC
jgi:hypothetical protein